MKESPNTINREGRKEGTWRERRGVTKEGLGEGGEVIHEFNGDYIQWVLYFPAHPAWRRSHSHPPLTFITSSFFLFFFTLCHSLHLFLIFVSSASSVHPFRIIQVISSSSPYPPPRLFPLSTSSSSSLPLPFRWRLRQCPRQSWSRPVSSDIDGRRSLVSSIIPCVGSG